MARIVVESLFFVLIASLLGCPDAKKEDPKPIAAQPITATASSARPAGGEASGEGDRENEREKVTTFEPLHVRVNGKDEAAWTVEQMNEVNKKTAKPGTEPVLETWSLRELASALVGPKARVVLVMSDESNKITIDDKSWADKAKIPTLRMNRQGQYKFVWSNDDGPLPLEGQVRDVKMIELAK